MQSYFWDITLGKALIKRPSREIFGGGDAKTPDAEVKRSQFEGGVKASQIQQFTHT